MSHADDNATLRAHLAETQRTLAALLAQDASADTAQAQQIAKLRTEIAALTAALRAQGEAVDDESAKVGAPEQRTIATAGGAYAEGDLHQQGVFVQGGSIQAPVIGVQTGGTIVIQSPQPTLSVQERRNRSRMLQKVRATWLPLLDETLQDVVRIDLDLKSVTALVDSPRKRLLQPDCPERLLPPGTPIHTVFDELAGELLILGAPGAGKTTLLLELARDLLAHAERDDVTAIPVVFNLSTWVANRGPFTDWLAAELNQRYDVPQKIAQAWVNADAVLPLLDGLDEVQQAQRAACVETINTYHREHGTPLAVCSRIADYEMLSAKLRLHGAILIQPLTDTQIDTYLDSAGEQLTGLRRAIQGDVVLRELAETPLLLSVMTLAYQGTSQIAIEAFGSSVIWRQHLFTAYIGRMLARPRLGMQYIPERTLHWLTWLARGMVRHSQSVFYLEYLQPTWLTKQQKRSYKSGTITISGVVFGLVFGSVFRLAAYFLIRLIFGTNIEQIFKEYPDMRYILSDSVTLVSIIGGVWGVMIGSLVSLLPQIKIVETLRWSWVDASIGTHTALQNGLLFGLRIGLIIGLWAGLLGGSEPIPGNWLEMRLSIGLDVGLKSMFISALIYGLFSWLTHGLGGGLVGTEIALRSNPNQGIWRSASTTLRGGLIVGMSLGLSIGLFFALLYGTGTGLFFGVSAGLLFGLSVGSFSYGGLACIQHLVLRILLWRNGSAPWNYARFLDYCADRILLRKVGGGYIFIHRMLLEYFAALEPEGTTDVSP